MVVIRIENFDVIPIQQRHIEFNSIEELLVYLKDTNTARSISISCIDNYPDILWILHIQSFPDFLEQCKMEGICGICSGKVDPEEGMPQFNKEYTEGRGYRIKVERGWVHCSGCGRKIGKMQHNSPIDIFYQSTRKINIEREFSPIPIDCGFCQGTGKIPIYEEEYGVYPTGEFDVCPDCLGKGHKKIEKDLMQL